MPDWPSVGIDDSLVSISTYGPETLLGQFGAVSRAVLAAVAWTTANTAVYMPVTISSPFLAQKMAVQVGTQSGNLDLGIYSEKGTRLVSMGSTAVGVAGTQVVDITDTWLMPGTYFVAMNCDNITATFIGVSVGTYPRACGVVQQAVGALALPNPATYAVYSTRNIPVVLVAGVNVI